MYRHVAVAYQLKFWCLSPMGLHGFSLPLPSFSQHSFSFVFPTYLYSALHRPKTISLLINGIHSIPRGIPHQNPLFILIAGFYVISIFGFVRIMHTDFYSTWSNHIPTSTSFSLSLFLFPPKQSRC